MAVLIGGLEPRSTTYDLSGYQLEEAFGIHALALGSRTFVYVAGKKDNGVSVFELGADGSLTSVQHLQNGATLNLAGASNFASVTLGSTTYLYVGASLNQKPGYINVFEVGSNGKLTLVEVVADTAETQLSGLEGKTTVATVGASTYLVTTGDDDDGISVFRIEADGTLTNTDNVTDDDSLELESAMDVVTTVVDGRTFAFVAGEDDDGVCGFELHADGTLTNTLNLQDDATLNLQGVVGMATAKVGGTAYVIASGRLDNGLSVFAVNDSGQLTNVCNLGDNATRGLGGAHGLTTFALGGETFLAVSGRTDNALSIFHLGTGGVLTDMTTVFDDASLALGDSYYNAYATAGDNSFLLATSYLEDGVTTFEIGGGNDTLTGTGAADVLLGLGGNDTLDGAGGNDRMLGGSGGDTYVVDSTGDSVEEQKGGGIDLVQAWVSTTLFAEVEHLQLMGTSALNGMGNTLANTLTGNSAANTLSGQGGDDLVEGAGGNDTLTGEAGGDVLKGGAGKDWLRGGNGADTLEGGAGNDTLAGNGGADDFVYKSEGDSPSGSGRDVIADFAAGVDDIVLTAIDADLTLSGDQAFVLDTNGSFSAGEIRQTVSGSNLLLEFNTDADSSPEMAILLKNVTSPLAATDFEL